MKKKSGEDTDLDARMTKKTIRVNEPRQALNGD